MLTEYQRAVLAWVVIDVDAHVAHVLSEFDEAEAWAMLIAKADRWSPEYEASADKRPRAERDEEFAP